MSDETTIDLGTVQHWISEIHASDRTQIDLSLFRHDSAVHTDLTPLAILGWWILGYAPALGVTLVLPPDVERLRLLARSGLLFAADRRRLPLVVNGRKTTTWRTLIKSESNLVLTNVDWQEFDSAGVDRLRAIPDLEDPRRTPPPLGPGGRRYQWVDQLGAGTALSTESRRRFDGDADRVLYEAISNVHRWSKASRAVAVCSVTKGGAPKKRRDKASWNRLHVVVFDNGIGIATALRHKRRSEGEEPNWGPEVERILDQDQLLGIDREDLTTALVYLLIERAFGDRLISSTKDGHGLHTAGVLANQWVGRLEILTATGEDADTAVVHVADTAGAIAAMPRKVLPGARGTMIHLTLNAVMNAKEKKSALDFEQMALPIPITTPA